LTLHLSHAPEPRPWPAMRRVLMVSPKHFRVEYAINAYMTTKKGELQRVDEEQAQKQWEELRLAYERLGFIVETMEADRLLPDMVFSANQSFPYWAEKPAVILGRMQSPQRQPEVPHFRRWYETSGYDIHELTTRTATFEGNGDALAHPARGLLW